MSFVEPRFAAPATFGDGFGPTIMDVVHDPRFYLGVAERTAFTRYAVLASAVVVVWDWLTTLDDEVSFIWVRRSKLTGKPLYLFLRYMGLAFQIFDCITNFGIWDSNYCAIYYYLVPIFSAIFVYTVDLLLGYRALCLYRMNTTLVVVNIMFFLASIISWIVIILLAYGNFTAVATPRFLTGCWSLLTSFVFLSAIPGIMLETWLFGLVAYRFISYSKAAGWNRQGIIRLVMKDSVSWFLVIQAMIIWNAFSLALLPLGLRALAIPPFRSAVIICGCRLVLHMRKAAAERDDDPRCASSSTASVHTVTIDQHCPSSDRDHRQAVSQLGPRPSSMQLEDPGTTRWVRIAQRIGLPPPLHEDFHSMWYDPVVTINRHARSRTADMEMSCVPFHTGYSRPVDESLHFGYGPQTVIVSWPTETSEYKPDQNSIAHRGVSPVSMPRNFLDMDSDDEDDELVSTRSTVPRRYIIV
ncbi:hypothetical protein FRB99_006448 [Tulasnella sp. 403]|nr:hypothetical protein FRB99_006448 [Tulasnella sp. 403]